MPQRPLQGKQTQKRRLTVSRTKFNPHPKRLASHDDAATARLSSITSQPSSPHESDARARAYSQPRTGSLPALNSSSTVSLEPHANTVNPSNAQESTIPNLNVQSRNLITFRNSPDNARTSTPERSEIRASSSSDMVQTIEKLLKDSEKRVLTHIVSQQRDVLTRISATEDRIRSVPSTLSSLKSEIAGFKKILIPTCNATAVQKGNSRGPVNRARNKTSISTLQNEVLLENPTLLSELNIVFNTDTSCVAAAKAIAYQLDKFNKNKESVSITARMMNAMLYGLLKDMPKASWKSGIGFRHAELRFRILKVILQTARTLPETLFTASGNEIVHSTSDAAESSKPAWLTSDFVRSNNLTLARKQHECIKSELPADPNEPLKRQSLYIAKSFMKVVIDMLRQSREKSRVRMFEDGVCCLLNWQSFDWFPNDLRNPSLSFVTPSSEPIQISAIPECAVGNLDDVRHHNAAIFRSLVTERQEMIVECLYDVHIKDNTTSNGRRAIRTSSETKSLRRCINLFRVSSSFLCGFCHLNDDKLLSTHPSMLKCMYRFALVLRQLFDNKINSDGDGCESGHSGIEESMAPAQRHANSASQRNIPNHRLETPKITIHELLPSESKVLRILQNTIPLSPDTFDKFNEPIDGNMDTGDAEYEHRSNLSIPEQDISDSEDDDLYDILQADE